MHLFLFPSFRISHYINGFFHQLVKIRSLEENPLAPQWDAVSGDIVPPDQVPKRGPAHVQVGLGLL